jgi:murein DD-endopeptidase MepM/ murein hydrolase activator NlpD
MKEYRSKRGGGIKKFIWLSLLPIAILVIAYLIYKIFLVPEPEIEGLEAFKYLSADKTITIEGKNIRSIDISIHQDAIVRTILKDVPDYSEKRYTLNIKPGELQLKDGPATVIVKAKSSIFKGIEHEIDSIIDTVPPVIQVISSPYQVFQGGAGFAILKAKDADAVFVRLEDNQFRAFLATEQEEKGISKTYFTFFPIPFDIKKGSILYAVAQDKAGNQDIKSLSTRLKKKDYKSSTIEIGDEFIKRVVFPLLHNAITDPVKAFRTVNEEWRKRDMKRLQEISEESRPEILWRGPFIQLKNSKVMATYGDRRTYYYMGKMIGQSVHLGYDLASISNAIIKAANTGVVRFADDLGIYGNTVIIDHGMGLMSLYGHLSDIMVREGEAVKKGAVIGRTGSTGFAGGDHLHFGMLIHGYEVSPLYWWDKHWIKVNISDKLEAFYAEISG